MSSAKQLRHSAMRVADRTGAERGTTRQAEHAGRTTRETLRGHKGISTWEGELIDLLCFL